MEKSIKQIESDRAKANVPNEFSLTLYNGFGSEFRGYADAINIFLNDQMESILVPNDLLKTAQNLYEAFKAVPLNVRENDLVTIWHKKTGFGIAGIEKTTVLSLLEKIIEHLSADQTLPPNVEEISNGVEDVINLEEAA